MQLNSKIYKLLSTKKASAGYTLMELLIGAAIATVVIGAAGFGLVQIMRTSQKGGAETERRTEIARAYTFIADEIRRARLVEDDTNISTDATNFTSTDKEVVLVLKIPVPDIDVNKDGTVDANDNRDRDGVDNNEANVIYYVSNPATSAWKGPKVLYRWGSPMGSDGEYTTGTWSGEPLIDELDATTITPSCESNWTASVAPGFAACIDPNNKTAQLFINGKIATAGGYNATYKSADTKTVARASSDGSQEGDGPEPTIRDLDGWFECKTPDTSKPQPPSVITGITFYDSNGVEMTGSTVTADDGTSLTPTKTVRTGGSGRFDDYKKDRMKVAAISQGCQDTSIPFQSVAPVSVDITIDSSGNVSATGETSKAIFLRKDYTFEEVTVDGKTYLKIKDAQGNYIQKDGEDLKLQAFVAQETLREFLEARGVEFDPDNKIILNDDELLIAFEIGQDSPTLDGTSEPNPGFDFQDKLVLITSDALNP